MSESSMHPVIPSPDPSLITAAAIKELKQDIRHELAERIDAVFRQIVTRLDAMDRASIVLSDNVTRVPTLLDREVNGLRIAGELRLESMQKLVNVQFDGVQTRFKERDDRQFASEAASKAAIDKSEVGFKDQIKALDTQLTSAKETLSSQFVDAKDRISRLETTMIAARDVRGDHRNEQNDSRSTVMVVVAVAGLLFTVVSAFIAYNLGRSVPGGVNSPPGYVLAPK